MNECRFEGKMVYEPELRQSSKGTKWMTFTLAVDTFSGGKGRTEQLKITAFGDLAIKISDTAFQGANLRVLARATTNSHAGSSDKKYTYTQLIADKVEVLDNVETVELDPFEDIGDSIVDPVNDLPF